MADELQPQRFIPFRKSDVVEMCLAEGRLPDSVGSAFRDFCRILEAFFHFEFHRVLERLKDCYAPFDPDADTRQIIILPDSDRERLLKELVREMMVLLNAANFEQITEESLKQSMAVESLFKIRLAVDFSDFEDILFFRRGEQIKEEVLVSFFGLKKADHPLCQLRPGPGLHPV